jgi:hypothetical protein
VDEKEVVVLIVVVDFSDFNLAMSKQWLELQPRQQHCPAHVTYNSFCIPNNKMATAYSVVFLPKWV